MADLRLTHEHKKTLIKIHEAFKGSDLRKKIQDSAGDFDLPHSGEFVLISKPEVTDEVWNELKRASVGQVIDFDNGDSDKEYRKAIKVERNVLEAIMAFLAALIDGLTKVVTGKAQGLTGGRIQGRARKPKEDAYER
jgi:hypothetical protein